MTGKLLDANAVIAFQKSDPGLVALLADQELSWYIPAPALGELYYGAFNSSQTAANLAALDRLASEVVIVRCDKSTAKLYGQIRHVLKSKGRPIPEADIWIAALALQHDLTLITRDAHFNEVDDMKLASW